MANKLISREIICTLEKTPNVSIIILNYNGKDVLDACIDSVLKSNYFSFEIIVVDNASTDGSDKIVSNYPSCYLVRNSINVGYCQGNNIGLGKARGKYVVLLNNDTIVHPDWLLNLVQFGETGADICAPKILFIDRKTINATGSDIHVMGFGMPRGGGEIDKGQYDNSLSISSFHGACIFLSKKAIKMVGPLDETFFAYNDDTDWAWRAALQNLKIVYVPLAIVYHKWGGGGFSIKSPRKFTLLERNRLIMILTNYAFRSLILLTPMLLITEVATIAYCFQNKLLKSKIKCYADLLLLRKYIQSRRKLIQEKRIVSDTVIITHFKIKFNHILVGHANPLNLLFSLYWKLVQDSF